MSRWHDVHAVAYSASWWRIGGLVLAVALVVSGVLALAGVWDEERPAEPVRTWRDSSVHGPWRSVFHGYGGSTGRVDELTLTPPAARDRDRTHAWGRRLVGCPEGSVGA
jgi:hypothetical protein